MFCDIFKLFVIYWICESVNCATAKNRQQRGCQLIIPDDVPKAEPLYLSGNPGRYRLFKPINASTHFAESSSLTLACTGRRNSLFEQRINNTELTCGQGNSFLDENGSRVKLREFNCTRGIEADLVTTRERCSNNRGYIFDIGFRIDRINFLSVFRVCYDNATETTYFSTHQINGAVAKYFVKDSRRRNFKTTGMSSNTNVERSYNKKNLIKRFVELFGPDQVYINNTMYLSRGHLTPDADFVFPNFQLATYFYVNVAPEFQSINGGNWVRIENMARELASDYKTDFIIFTGVHETLALPDRNGNPVEIYLDSSRKINVPKWFWKVIKNGKSGAAIAMITLNNPFARREDIREFCPNVCQRASLTSKYFDDVKKGYTFCCEIESFSKVVNDLPKNFTATALLECARANHVFQKD